MFFSKKTPAFFKRFCLNMLCYFQNQNNKKLIFSSNNDCFKDSFCLYGSQSPSFKIRKSDLNNSGLSFRFFEPTYNKMD